MKKLSRLSFGNLFDYFVEWKEDEIPVSSVRGIKLSVVDEV